MTTLSIQVIAPTEPTVPFASIEEYMQWVDSVAFASYDKQYDTKGDLVAAITAAMEAKNADILSRNPVDPPAVDSGIQTP